MSTATFLGDKPVNRIGFGAMQLARAAAPASARQAHPRMLDYLRQSTDVVSTSRATAGFRRRAPGNQGTVATTEADFSVPPERVFSVLSDPESYADWVVGSHSIRDADSDWPAVGSRFYHRVGVGRLTVKDHTEVLEVDPLRRLVLRARARPLGTAKVELVLESRAGGTHVTMTEVAGDPLSRLAINRLTDPLVHHRNVESLRRLRRISETGVVKS